MLIHGQHYQRDRLHKRDVLPGAPLGRRQQTPLGLWINSLLLTCINHFWRFTFSRQIIIFVLGGKRKKANGEESRRLTCALETWATFRKRGVIVVRGLMNLVLNHCRATQQCACTVWITGSFAEEVSCCTDEGFRRRLLCVLATSSLCEMFHFVPSRWEGRFLTVSSSTVAAFWFNCVF